MSPVPPVETQGPAVREADWCRQELSFIPPILMPRTLTFWLFFLFMGFVFFLPHLFSFLLNLWNLYIFSSYSGFTFKPEWVPLPAAEKPYPVTAGAWSWFSS